MTNVLKSEMTLVKDEWEVMFDGLDDIEDATNLSRLRKWIIIGIISFGSLHVTCVSSVWTLASPAIIEHFGISHEVSVLGISLFIWGLGTGSIFLSPISEFHGRKMVYVVGLVFMISFQCITAFSRNIGAMLFGRFAAGFAGLSFLLVATGSFSDLFKNQKKDVQKTDSNRELAMAMVIFSISPFIGPGIGPLISGFINSNLQYRWTFYVMLIWTFVELVLISLFVPETCRPVLLVKKAQRLRRETGDGRYWAPLERNRVGIYESILTSSKRPISLVLRDKMTFAICFYSGFTLAVVYLFFVAFPYTFAKVYGFGIAAQGMSFLGLVVGMATSTIVSPYFVNKNYVRLLARNNGRAIPEFRLVQVIVGVFIVPVGLFIFAWTTYKRVHWIFPIIGSGIYGGGTILVFNGIFSYTVEAYRLYAASAMATNTFIRATMSGIFPLFGLQMFKALGIHWASTLLGIFACTLIPGAFLLYHYGEKLRATSPYTWNDPS